LAGSKFGKTGRASAVAKQETKKEKTLTRNTNPLAEIDDGLRRDYQRKSTDLIYEAVMRGGGEPFGAPFEAGVGSLTDRIVKLFRQKSFFGFETLDRPRRKNRGNRFTRYGASPFRGALRAKKSTPER
jgi:hypothetical protein